MRVTPQFIAQADFVAECMLKVAASNAKKRKTENEFELDFEPSPELSRKQGDDINCWLDKEL